MVFSLMSMMNSAANVKSFINNVRFLTIILLSILVYKLCDHAMIDKIARHLLLTYFDQNMVIILVLQMVEK
jgi:hypothetical protein